MNDEHLPRPPLVARVSMRPSVFRAPRRQRSILSRIAHVRRAAPPSIRSRDVDGAPPVEGLPGRSVRVPPRSARPRGHGAESNIPAPILSTVPPSAPRASPIVGRVIAAVLVAAAVVVTWQVKKPAAHVGRVVSGTAGLKVTPSGAHERWGTRPLVVALDGSLAKAGAKDAVRAAFGTWLGSGAALPPITFDDRSDSGKAAHDGVNRVLIAPITVPGHEHDVAITISYADAQTGVIQESDVVLNAAYAFAQVGPQEEEAENERKEGKGASPKCAVYDVQEIATHEIGHFLGLGEDMTDTSAAMYIVSAPCETHKRQLTDADRGVVSALYKELALTSPPAGGTSSGGDPQGASASDASAGGCGGRVAPRASSGDELAVPAFALVAAAALVRARRKRAG